MNIKDGVIRNGSSIGSGSAIGNVKNGVIRKSSSSSAGSGNSIGKVKDYTIKGADYVDEATMVACYHFLIKEIF